MEEFDDDEIEYLSEEDLAKTVAVSKFSNAYYVYFEENGDISSVSNEKKEGRTNFLEFDYSDVEQFITGTENIINYRLSLMDKDTPALVEKSQNLFDSNKSIFTPIEVKDTANSTLTIVWNYKDSQWEFNLEPTYKDKLRTLGLNTTLSFFIALDRNVNFLVRTIRIDMRELTTTPTVVVPFLTDAERDLTTISVSSKRFFDSYGLVTHE